MIIIGIMLLAVAIGLLVKIKTTYGQGLEYSWEQFCSDEVIEDNSGVFECLNNEEEADNDGGLNENLLILVNKDNKLSEEYYVNLKLLNDNVHSVAEVIYDDLECMLADGSDNGLSFCIASAYRSYEYQQSLIDEYISEAMAEGLSYKEACVQVFMESMPPGYSEHETGLAVDIVAADYQMLDGGQELTAENKWLRENCYKYGFILRYPEDKEDITGISYESWHFRYVGKRAAGYITKNNLTLEEYLELIGD